jgi:predicted membrane-bound spermidine synthase
VSGKAEASSAAADMRLERMMGHVPGLLHPHPRSVLTVGFGAGVTAGSFVPYPDVESLVICELEPLIPPASTEFFSRENNSVMREPRTRIVYDERSTLHLHDETKIRCHYDRSDPSVGEKALRRYIRRNTTSWSKRI